jgi:hypothetical protein
MEETLRRLRACGWMVAVHNDYRKGKKLFTFWLMTREDGRFLKGEGPDGRYRDRPDRDPAPRLE